MRTFSLISAFADKSQARINRMFVLFTSRIQMQRIGLASYAMPVNPRLRIVFQTPEWTLTG